MQREKVRCHTVSEWKLFLSSHRYMLPFASHDEICGNEPETQEDDSEPEYIGQK